MAKKRSITMERNKYRDWKSTKFWMCAEETAKLFRIPANVKKIRFTISVETFEGAREYVLWSPIHSSYFYRMTTKRNRALTNRNIPASVREWIEPIVGCKGSCFYGDETKPIFIKLEILETV